VRDARERRVLPADEDPGMPHHGDEKTGLTIREAEGRERAIALGGRAIRIRQVQLHAGRHLKVASRTNAPRCSIPDTPALTRFGIAPTLTL